MKTFKRQLTVKRLPRLEYHGDWHDKPVKWITVCESDSLFTQKFPTKKDALKWSSIAKRAVNFREAFLAFN